MAQVKALIGNIKGPAGENFSTYSTDEQVVGKWINGKPIYRKCFKNVAFSNLDISSNANINHPIIIKNNAYICLNTFGNLSNHLLKTFFSSINNIP